MNENESTDVVTIRLYYDFASTLCYVAHRVLTEVEGRIAEAGVELEWCPLDLTMIVPWDLLGKPGCVMVGVSSRSSIITTPPSART